MDVQTDKQKSPLFCRILSPSRPLPKKEKQGRIHGQSAVAGGGVGSRGSKQMGRGSHAGVQGLYLGGAGRAVTLRVINNFIRLRQNLKSCMYLLERRWRSLGRGL